jgi:hypothetical protein
VVHLGPPNWAPAAQAAPPRRPAPPAQATLAAEVGPPSHAAQSTQAAPASRMPAPAGRQARRTQSGPARTSTRRYQQHIPPSVWNTLVTTAKVPLLREEPLYRDVAAPSGLRWELLAACDWMQCKGRLGYSPVHGEKLGAVNPDGTTYRTKSEALERCADDLVRLAHRVYQIDLTANGNLSVRDLANVFAAFRWGGLLRLHHTSAMEFPYSVAGLTVQHLSMRWPNIADSHTPDKPGGRFRMPFGAVPIVLSLNYQATV